MATQSSATPGIQVGRLSHPTLQTLGTGRTPNTGVIAQRRAIHGRTPMHLALKLHTVLALKDLHTDLLVAAEPLVVAILQEETGFLLSRDILPGPEMLRMITDISPEPATVTTEETPAVDRILLTDLHR